MSEDPSKPGWDWPKLTRIGAPPVVRQRHPDGCGAACAVMLLADRGVSIPLKAVEAVLPMPSRPDDLAGALERLAGTAWVGGMINVGLPAGRELVQVVCEHRGSWAALLEPLGLGHIGHWVVVDGVTEQGAVLVRDPEGTSYGVPSHDFATLWRYVIGVIQEPA